MDLAQEVQRRRSALLNPSTAASSGQPAAEANSQLLDVAPAAADSGQLGSANPRNNVSTTSLQPKEAAFARAFTWTS